MIKGLNEVIEHWEDTAWYFVVEKYFRNVIFEGFLGELREFECPGYKVSDEIYIGDGILRIVLVEDE